ncbi:MipA/OmpV family protein [Pseudomonas sp. NPDC089554]|uniref:MipA/OmpV family protein n=1 Tax=Pseudomonas sp. NPDC089554 TaxID=3390653 RepID=UPI003D01B270
MPRLDANTPRLSTSALSLAGLSLLAVAQWYSPHAAAEQGRDGGSSWALGVGVKSEKTPYKGRDRETDVLPLIQYENDYIEIVGPGIAFKLPSLELSDSQQLDFSLVGEFDGSGYEDDDARILEGMRERKSGFWGGGRVTWKNDWADLSAEWLGDVSGNSKGQRVSLGLERTWHIGNDVMITPRLGANWYDKKYVDYYFGVRQDEARFDRAAYDGKSGVNAEIGVRSVYMLDKHHSMFMDVEASSLSSGIKDSPLVDRSSQNNVTFGYIYRF